MAEISEFSRSFSAVTSLYSLIGLFFSTNGHMVVMYSSLHYHEPTFQ